MDIVWLVVWMVVWTWYGHSLFGGMDGGMDMVWHGLNGVWIDFKLFKWTTQIKFKCLLLCQEGRVNNLSLQNFGQI